MPEAPDARVRAKPLRRQPLWLPPATLLVVTGASWWIFNHSSRAVAEAVIGVYAASLVLGPSVVHPWMRAWGAGGRAAVLGALVVPGAWLVKESYRVTANFSVGEAVYYALNPLAQGLFVAVALQLALWEIVIERRHRGVWRLHRGPAITLGLVAAYAALTRWVAVHWGPAQIFYSYVALHARLFGGG